MNKPDDLYLTALQAAPTPLLLLEASPPEFRIILANEAFCRTTCASTGSLTGKTLSEVFTEDFDFASGSTLPELNACVEKVVRSKSFFELTDLQFPQHHENGKAICYWNVACTPIRIGDSDEVSAILCTATDVTKEFHLKSRTKEAELETQASLRQLEHAQEEKHAADEANALLNAIINTTLAGISLLSPVTGDAGALVDFRFRMVNNTMADYVSRTPNELSARLVSQWLPAYKTNGLFEQCRKTLETATPQRFEFHYDNDGINSWFDVMCAKVNNEVLVTFTDYTALKNLQSQLEENLTELRNSNANLEQFAYAASHDLQEPLRKVKSFGDILQSRYGALLGNSGADLISRMQSAAARMGTLIDDLLTYSRASVKPSEFDTLDTNKILDGVLLDLEELIRQKNATIHRTELLPTCGKATQIGQVFYNLVNNALKFHKAGCTPEIWIETAVVAGKNAGILVATGDREKRYQRILVKDNGIGFDNEYRDNIFQIFQRLNNRSDYPGSGVGLSIVKKVVENHSGYIEASAVPGEGATFILLMPLAASAA